MDSSLDISNNVHSNSSFLSEDRSPGSSPGVTIQPINFVSSVSCSMMFTDCIFSPKAGLKRCRALYDCNADNDDELEFKEGEILVVLNERTDDENWMEGVIESDPSRRGMFPVSFVHILPD